MTNAIEQIQCHRPFSLYNVAASESDEGLVWSKTILGTILAQQKSFVRKKNNVGSKKILGQQKILGQKKLTLMRQQNVDPKKSWPKIS